MKQKFLTANQLTDIAFYLSISVVIQLFIFFLVIFNIGIGGSISISMIPLFILIYKHGYKIGLIGTILYGVFEMVMYSIFTLIFAEAFYPLADNLNVFLSVVFLDYIVAFGIITFSLPVFNIKRGSTLYFTLGIILGGLLRYIVHITSGAILFSGYLAETFPNMNVVIASIIFNASYMIPTIVLTAIIGALIFIRIRFVIEK